MDGETVVEGVTPRDGETAMDGETVMEEGTVAMRHQRGIYRDIFTWFFWY